MKQELLSYLIGEGSIAQLIGALIFGHFAAFVLYLYRVQKRDPQSPRTPFKFSWEFFWCDNSRRILRTVFSIFLLVRFSREFLGAEQTMYGSVLIGLASDRLGKLMARKAKAHIPDDEE